MSQILTGRYSSTTNPARTAAFTELRDLARTAKIITKEKSTKNLFQKITENVIAVEKMSTKCCYCEEIIALPYVWIFDLSAKKLLKIIDAEKGEEFFGWDSSIPNFNKVRMKHPHVSGQDICTGDGRTAFTGKYAAMNALMMGLNPSSPFFSVKGWLATIGHTCDGTRYCPDHGLDCGWRDTSSGREFDISAAWACRLVYKYKHALPCGCEGDAFLKQSYLIECGSKSHHYSWNISQIVNLMDITQILVDYGSGDVNVLIDKMNKVSDRINDYHSKINSLESFIAFINQ
jgi:hypothetical protein